MIDQRPGPKRIRDLESPDNPLLKVFRHALAEGTTRERWLAVEGPLLLEEALAAAPRTLVHSVLVARGSERKFSGLLARLPREGEMARVPDRLFQKLAQTEAPQGIAALVELRQGSLEDVVASRDALLLVACGLQDPGNLGTMARSAYALGGTALVTITQTVNPFNPKAVRASAGAIFRLPIFANLEPEALFPRLRAAGVQIIAADRHSPSPVAKADLRGPVAFLIGQEAAGLKPALAKEAGLLLSIPVRSEMDSINAATAASIFLYEAARQRGFRY